MSKSKFICLLIFCLIVVWQANEIFAQVDSPESLLKVEANAKEFYRQWNRSSVQKAAETYIKAFKGWKQLEKFDKALPCLREAGRLNIILGERQTALTLYQQGLAIADKNYLNDEKANFLSALSLWAFDVGRIDESRHYFEQSLALATNSENPSVKAFALFSAGEFYNYRKELNIALNYFQQSADLWRKANDPAGEANTLLEIGYIQLDEQLDFDKAIITFNNALLKWQELDDKGGQAIVEIALGSAYSVKNEKQKAIEVYQNAEKLFPPDLDYFNQATLYNAIGAIYSDFGLWQISLSYREKALHNYEQVSHLYGQMYTLSSLAVLSNLTGNEQASLKYFNLAQSLAIKTNEQFLSAYIKECLGDFHFGRDSYPKALKYYRQSLIFFQKNGNKRQISQLYNKLGRLYETQNKTETARRYYFLSIELNKIVKDDFNEAETTYNIGYSYALTKDFQNALKFAEESTKITENLSTDVNNSKLKSTYFSNIFERYALYINLLMQMQKQSSSEVYTLQALQSAEKSRARSMLENLALCGADFTKDADLETVKREKEIRVLLNVKADKLTDLLSSNADHSATGRLDDEISGLETELEEISAKLKQQSPIYSAVKNPAPFNVAEFQQNVLDDNSLLLEFSFGKKESYLWVVGKNEVGSYVLPPREQIESRIEKLRKLIDSRGMLEGETVESYQARVNEAEIVYKTEAGQLSNELFGQIGDKFSGKRLIIVPDGKLHYFPIAALPMPDSADDTPILLTNETIYEPSAATLALLMRNGQKPSAATKNLLVFSDPIFSNQDARVSGVNSETQNETGAIQTDKFRFAESLTSLVRLNASKDESDSIIEIVGASESTALSGAAATREKALDASIGDYKIIHFATHGLIKEDRPELSGIVLSQVDGGGQPVNGVVRLQDIYAMNLSADAVVLSACDTGIGKEVKGEGLMSLNNAFLQTGAKTVVSTLWKVDDYAARELMKNFYSELASGKVSTSEALRRAQIKLRQNPQYQSPFYWAAFTIEGDYQNIPQFSVKRNYKIYALVSIILLGLFALYLYRRRLKSVHKIR